jgi:hypothetical protein
VLVLALVDGLVDGDAVAAGDEGSALADGVMDDAPALGDVPGAAGGTVAQALSSRATPRALSARIVVAMHQR